MDQADLQNRFNYHKPSPEAVKDHEKIRSACLDLATAFNIYLPEGREKSLAMTALEQAMFWGNAAIAREA